EAVDPGAHDDDVPRAGRDPRVAPLEDLAFDHRTLAVMVSSTAPMVLARAIIARSRNRTSPVILAPVRPGREVPASVEAPCARSHRMRNSVIRRPPGGATPGGGPREAQDARI